MSDNTVITENTRLAFDLSVGELNEIMAALNARPHPLAVKLKTLATSQVEQLQAMRAAAAAEQAPAAVPVMPEEVVAMAKQAQYGEQTSNAIASA